MGILKDDLLPALAIGFLLLYLGMILIAGYYVIYRPTSEQIKAVTAEDSE
jgi:hypothetical protein